MDRGVDLFLRKYNPAECPSVDCTIHPSDEMYFCHVPLVGSNKAWMTYFKLGSDLTRTILRIAEWRFGAAKIGEIKLLEFACGHGRVVRHLVTCFPRENVSVSDIYESAVQFNIDQFGVSGQISAHNPEDFHCDKRFDLIVVPSLFSHFPESTFAAWIRVLFDLLTDDGILVFSVHGAHLLSSDVVVPENGIVFQDWSESKTLDPQEYGMSYVTEDFVHGQIVKATGRDSYSFTKRGFCRHQDFYIIPKADLTDVAKFKYDRGVEANINGVEMDAHGSLWMSGWGWDTHLSGEQGQAVVVSLDGRPIHTENSFLPSPDVAAIFGNEFRQCGFTFTIQIPVSERRPESLLTIEIVSPFHRDCIYALPLGDHLRKIDPVAEAPKLDIPPVYRSRLAKTLSRLGIGHRSAVRS